MRSSLRAILVFLLLVAAPQRTWCIASVVLESMHCTFSPTYIANLTTSIVKNAFYMDMILVHILPQGFRGNVNVQMRLTRSAKYQSLFAYDFDMCDIMHNVQRLKIMQKWYKRFLKFSNFMENCPILEGNYFLKNLTVDPNHIPSYLQVGSYRVIARAYFGKYKTKSEKFVGECQAGVQLQ